jgi:hypothetical protein
VSGLAYAGWAILGAAGLALWSASHVPGEATARPLAVLSRLCTGPVVRVALVVGVMWVGWHLFAR